MTRNVLHARIVSGRGGGPEKTILNSARHLLDSEYRSIACYLHAPGDDGIEDLARRASEKGSPFVALPDSKPVDFGVLRRLGELCREREIAIWHGHDYKSNLYGLWLARKHDLKLVTTVHGWVKHTRKTPLYYAVDRFCIKRYREVICVSTDLEARCREFGVRPERLTHVPNAIDTDEFRRARPAAASALRRDMPPGRLLVGAVGRLSDEKGFDLLIDAVARLVAKGLDLELWIAGEGEFRADLEARAAASGAADRIRLLGFRSDTVELFEAFDVFCLSSLREGLPNVVLEAMAMEVPVLATLSGGMDTFARDGEDALLVPTGSSEVLEAGLERLAGDARLRARLATAARERIVAEYGFARRMARVRAIYDRLF